MKNLFYEAKMFFSQRLIYILIPLAIFYLFMGLQETVIMLPLTYVMQFLVFGFMVIGYWTGVREPNEGSSSVIQVTPYAYKHWKAKVISPTAYAIALNLVLIVVFLAVAAKEQVGFSWMLGGARFMLLYFVLPSLISLMIGLILAQYVRSKLAYAIILVLGFLLGPLGGEVFHTFMGFLFAEGGTNADSLYAIGSNLINTFRLSPYSYNNIPNELYGFVAESVNYYRTLCFLFVVSGAYFLIQMKKAVYPKSKRYLAAIGGSSLALALLFGVLMQQPVFIYRQGHADSLGDGVYDQNWVWSNPVVEIDDRDPEIVITKVEGELDLRQSLRFEGVLTIENPNQTYHFSMKLYRGFLVKALTVSDGEATWKQEGDWIHVKLAKPSSFFNVNITYAGFSSPYFFAGEQAVWLPGYYAFLPQMSSKPVFGDTQNKDVYIFPFEPSDTEFELKVQSKLALASNLEESNGRWSGTLQKEGPIFVGGLLEELQWNGIPLYVAGMPDEKREIAYLTELTRLTNKIRQDLGRQPPDPISRVFFVPYTNSIVGGGHAMQQGSSLYVHTIMQRVDPTPGLVLGEAVTLFLNSDPRYADAYRVLPSIDSADLDDKILSWAAKEYGIDASEVPMDDRIREMDNARLSAEIEERLERLADDTN